MEGRSMEVAKVCTKMHKHVFDGENIDMNVVIKDVYDNFTCIFKAITYQLENLESKILTHYHRQIFNLRKAVGFLITFCRCMLKRYCVNKGTGVIDRSLIDILMDVEIPFVHLFELCASQVSREKFLELLREDKYYRTIRASHAYLAVFSTESFPTSMDFINSMESVLEFVDQVMDDLHQCEHRSNWIYPRKNIEAFVKKLESMRNCLEFTKDRMSRESMEEFLICFEGFAESAACYTFVVKYGSYATWNWYTQIVCRLETKMGVVVLKAYVMKLQDYTDSLAPLTDGPLKDYLDCIQENLTELINEELTTRVKKDEMIDLGKELEFLADLVLNNPPKHEAEQERLLDIRARFLTLVANVGSVLFLFRNMAAETTTLEISDFMEKARLLKGSIIHIFMLTTFDRIGRNSPKTNTLGFLNFLIDNLRELKHSTFNLKETYEAGDFQAIHENLVLLRSFLNKTADDDESKDLLKYRIRCAAYEAEHFINSSVAGAIFDSSGRSGWFSDFKQQVKQIEATIADICEKRSANDHIDHNIDINDVGSSKNIPSPVRSLALVPTTDVVVGFEEEMELIKERLTSDLGRKLDVISIVGMGGLGKTTFAKKVYDDPSIIDHFQIRAWCCVSQDYDKKELLQTILLSITKLTADAYALKSYGDLSVMLHKQLTGSRYLIVMDDIWGMGALKDLKRFFPDNSNGSRIMLTSRNRLEDCSDPIELRFLTNDESWDLLKQKVYQKNEECPSGLCPVGKTIAEKCQGLPLAIVLVAGILPKSEKDRGFWEQVAGNLSTSIAGDTTTHNQVMAALELSYEFLPDHLKSLFLYLGAFPEDTEIPANKLMCFWIAEEFVHKNDDDQLTNSLELQSELNLMDLIDRSLVMISERRSDGRVKSCRIHDLLRDMCLEKAKQENFMRQINVRSDSPDPITYERRLSISLNSGPSPPRRFIRCQGLPMLAIPPPLSSFLFFNINKTHAMEEEDVKAIFCNFRLLRILDAEGITVNADTYRDYVVKLVHLRYISIRTDWKSIPSSISKLWNLETLIIKGLGAEIVVPEEIWTLVKLRHLHINHRANFNGALLDESSSKLEKLQTLSTPIVCCGEEQKLIRRVPNIRKFRFISVEAKNSNGNFEYQLPQLESLDQLKSLKIICHNRVRCISGQFGFPTTLKKLTLSKFRLQWSEISSFGQKLPNLEVLKLRGGTFEDTLWETGDIEFSKLKFLKLESLNIKQWIVSPENFPCLKKLALQSCKKLEEIPSSVGDFYSLEKIEVLWCSNDAAKSAQQILEEQRDNGNELLKVQVHFNGDKSICNEYLD